MSKAYDRVEWTFLKEMMLRLGFSRRWVDLIMTCISSVKYRIRVNGVLIEEFVPERGLRQGDPISRYLFLLCDERFSSLLHKASWRVPYMVSGSVEGHRQYPICSSRMTR